MAIPVPAVGDQATAAYADAVANAVNAPLVGEVFSGASTTLSTTAAFAGSATYTFTLAVQTRVRIHTTATFTMTSGTAGHYTVRSGYNSGSSAVIGSFLGVGASYFTVTLSVAGGNGANSGNHEGTVLLPAGTYTAYGSVQRNSGGTVTDTASNCYVSVTAVGFA